jgi:hypothetical protein
VTSLTEKAAATDERGSLQMVGHGSKFGRKKEAAIVALLTQRNFMFQEVQTAAPGNRSSRRAGGCAAFRVDRAG